MTSRYYSISNGYDNDNGIQKVLFQGGNKPAFGDILYFRHKASGEIIESIYTIQNYLTITNDLDYPFYIGFNLTSDISLDNRFMESVDDGETWFPVTEESYQVESQLSEETGKYTILLAGINNTSIFGTEIFFGRFDNGNPVIDNLEINVSGNLASLGNCNDLTVLQEAREFFWANSIQLKSVESLIIPARVSCANTFCGCTSLISTPILDFTGMDSVPWNGFGQFFDMFASCTSLTTCSIEFPPIYYSDHACQQMFYGCTSLTTLPRIEVSGADAGAFDSMFENCSSIRLAESQDSTYSTAYTITGTPGSSVSSSAFTDMFKNTGGTFTGTPVFGTTYYTSNTVVPAQRGAER